VSGNLARKPVLIGHGETSLPKSHRQYVTNSDALNRDFRLAQGERFLLGRFGI
jgi:hypothetical protein